MNDCCECPLFETVRHFCQRHGFHVNQTERQLCEKSAAHREAFSRPDAPQRVREVRLRAAAAKAAATPAYRPVAPEDFPCLHRLAILDQTRLCNLCGLEKGKPFEVFGCSLHGECSVGRKHSKVRNCVACSDRAAAIEAAEPVPGG